MADIPPCYETSTDNGVVSEWLCGGLQIHLRGFDSLRRLHSLNMLMRYHQIIGERRPEGISGEKVPYEQVEFRQDRPRKPEDRMIHFTIHVKNEPEQIGAGCIELIGDNQYTMHGGVYPKYQRSGITRHAMVFAARMMAKEGRSFIWPMSMSPQAEKFKRGFNFFRGSDSAMKADRQQPRERERSGSLLFPK